MAETVKKPKTARKPRATTSEKAPVAPKKPAAPRKKTAKAKVVEMKISHEQIAMLAHRYFEERGRKHGHDAEDWLRAEAELLGKAS